MARAPEILNIASFYLKNTLEKTASRVAITVPFETMNDSIEFKTKTKIPDSLIENLRLQDLRWMRFSHKDALSLLYVDKKTRGIPFSDHFNNDYKDATATIEIAQKKQFDESINGWKDIPVVVRIASIYKEQNRIVAVTYDLEDNNRLTKLNISLPIEENINSNEICWKIMPQYINIINNLKAIFPTDVTKPYTTAGLITREMYKKVSPSFYEYPSDAIIIQFLNDNSIVVGETENSSEKSELFNLFKGLGYYVSEEKGLIKVGLSGNGARERDLLPWKISVPKFLQKV